MSFRRSIPSAKKTPLKKDSDGNILCRWCGKIPKPPRKTFCNDECVFEWKIRSSPSFARKIVFKRDKGICSECGLDTKSLGKGLKRPLKGETKEQWHRRVTELRKKYNIPKYRKTLYDVDHIVPVCEGGGADIKNLLDNLRLLCIFCHQTITQKLLQKRRKNFKNNKIGGKVKRKNNRNIKTPKSKNRIKRRRAPLKI